MVDIFVEVFLGNSDLLSGCTVGLLVEGVESKHLFDVLNELVCVQILVRIVLGFNAD